MKAILLTLLTFGLIGCAAQKPVTPKENSSNEIVWQDWSQSVFDRAAKQHKLVLLHLGAGWCHWCHVMEQTTYHDPQVVRLIQEHYIAIHVDQDSRPDLANRYEDYGWPATIFFDASGKELVKWRGYIPPERMRSLLQATVDDPTPGPSAQIAAADVTGGGVLPPPRKFELVRRFDSLYDTPNGGWGSGGDKFLQADALEYEMNHAVAGDSAARDRAIYTLNEVRKIIDPVWGGVDQYSTDGDWQHPHYEKLIQFQADGLQTYARAYQLWHDPDDLASAKAIDSFMQNFLRSSQGAFYVSQDADAIPGQQGDSYFSLDDASRRKIGVPRVDRHLYARENGWAARGFLAMYAATNEAKYLQQAKEIIAWVEANRSLSGGGFRHDEKDAAGPYLGDSLAMSQAYLSLFEATGNRDCITKCENAIGFIEQHFKNRDAGYVTAGQIGILPTSPQFDENVALARTVNLLYQYTGKPQYKQMAEHAMKYITAPAVTDSHFVAGVLLVADEVGTEPMHVTIVGAMDEPVAQSLHQAALNVGIGYLRLDWYDPRQGPPLRNDVQYPQMSKPAAFLCTNGACSAPVSDPEKLKALMLKRAKTQ